MKIGMSGTGGVGKTTILNEIKKVYPHLKQPISSARYVFEKRGMVEADQLSLMPMACFDIQEEIRAHWLKQFNEIQGDSIWDRTPLDHYGYGMARNHACVNRVWLENTKRSVIKTINSFTHFFFFPIPKTWEPTLDAVRDSAPGTRLLVHMIMDNLLNQIISEFNSSLKFYEVPTDYPAKIVREFVLDRIK